MKDRSSLRARVLGILERHRGRDAAISVRDGALSAGIDSRLYQVIVRELVEAGHLIGTSYGKPPGNYLIVDPEEVAAIAASLQRQGFGTVGRARRLLRSADLLRRRRESSPQLSLFEKSA